MLFVQNGKHLRSGSLKISRLNYQLRIELSIPDLAIPDYIINSGSINPEPVRRPGTQVRFQVQINQPGIRIRLKSGPLQLGTRIITRRSHQSGIQIRTRIRTQNPDQNPEPDQNNIEETKHKFHIEVIQLTPKFYTIK